MKKTIIIVLVLLFGLVQNVQAEDIMITPETFSLNLTAGESTTYNITVTNSGSNSYICILETNITPDSYGINISYQYNKFNINSQSSQTIIVTVNTSIALAPGNYVILTEVSGKENVPSGGGGSSSSSSSSSYMNVYNPPPAPPADQLPSNPPPEVPPFQNVRRTYTPSLDPESSFVYYGIFVLFALLIISFLYIYTRKRNAKK